ncbi:bifunctional diguanylate cyclase/phosphodiesterase [Kineosporia sp. J2-2]|uniref:Bifunctional diguanylate cyclase/phosphodiesterase n=1 Tax=Kineosporia corallincola TaxID=2835133 RepID=A0ABS5TE05_9ACTN|nr:bifunctional diguanylate cyclase/phosphodiesterase [Kineosporia corallincola]MBT0769320.1 bifunctional diguanylate cyclase/phosphodiesterase [Kineosporia corallincola]
MPMTTAMGAKWLRLRQWWGLHAGARFFVTLAVISLVPVLALGTVMATQYRTESRDRGVAQGRLQAALISRLITDNLLEQVTLKNGINNVERTRLDRLADTQVDSGIISRFRLRGPDLRIIYSSDGSGLRYGPAVGDSTELDGQSASDVLTALDGEAVASIVESGGSEVVEAFAPLYNVRSHALMGVLQVEVPYGPIAAQMNAGLHQLYFALGTGLLTLYLVLAALVWWFTRELARAAAKFEHQALHDTLTDLPNKALFSDRISQTATLVERGGGIHLGPGRRGGGAAVVLFNLDGFRDINEAIGPVNGDVVLTTVAERLRNTVRAVDTVAGLGGDLYGLILAGVEKQDQIEAAAARINRNVEEDIVLDAFDVPVRVSGSMGVVFMPKNGTNAEVLLDRADVALHVAKTSHSKLVCYDDEQNNYSPDRLAMIGQLRDAITNEELRLHYLPKVDQPDGHVTCVEALVRWQHPDRGLLSPDQFVPLAEQTGLIDDLTRWVLTTALRQLSVWRRVRDDLSVAVNISERSMNHLDLPQMVFDALTETGVPPASLLLEITEAALVADQERAGVVMQHLSGAGVRLSLDDFGEGFTSLSHLAELPLNELKIDRIFVKDMLESPNDTAIVRSVVELGHNLNLEVVAEGVETAEILAALNELGVNGVQGYFFTPPLPATEIMDWIGARTPANDPTQSGDQPPQQ